MGLARHQLSRPPNILLLMTDQQRADTVHAVGSSIIRTPVLDRLSRGGSTFMRAYTASPVCVSARCALLTGLPPHVTGCVDNQMTPRHLANLPTRLGQCGYQTHGVGKMHFYPDPYARWGFDSRDTSEEISGPGDDYVEFLRSEGFGHVLEPHGLRSEYYYLPQPSQVPERLHHTRWVADRSIEFLSRRNQSAPFFLMSSFIKPHPPFETPVPWDRMYRTTDVTGPDIREGDQRMWTYWNRSQNRYKYTDAGRDEYLERTRKAGYYAAISYIDYQIGRILAALGDALDHTLVVFTSDHGEFMGDYGCYGKRSMLDAAARVPLIVHQPGEVPAGRWVRTPASHLDVLPTLLGAAQADEHRVHEEGEDLITLAREDDRERVVYSQYQQGRFALYMAASARHKVMYSAPDERTWWLAPSQADGRDTEGLRESDETDAPRAAAPYIRLERNLLERFTRAGYTQAVAGGSWTRYDRPVLDDAPMHGLLIQDPPALRQALSALPEGYETTPPPPNYTLLATPHPLKPPADLRPTVEVTPLATPPSINGHPAQPASNRP